MKAIQLIFFHCFTIILFLMLATTGHSQTTTDTIVTYDDIQLKNGPWLRGKIISFDKEDGDIIFVDRRGRKYFLGKDDYEHFEYNKEPRTRRKKNRVPKTAGNSTGVRKDSFEVRPRKESEFEVTLGISPYSLLLAEGSFEDSDKSSLNTTLMAVRAQLGVGKYFNRQHYLGLMFDYAILPNHYFGDGVEGKVNNYFSVGPRYKFQYDAYKSNTAFYLAAMANYTTIKGEFDYEYIDQFGSVGFSKLQVQEKNDAMSLSLGQGIAFILNNKKSVNLELSVTRHFTLNTKKTGEVNDPNVESLFILKSRRLTAVTLSVMYNL